MKREHLLKLSNGLVALLLISLTSQIQANVGEFLHDSGTDSSGAGEQSKLIGESAESGSNGDGGELLLKAGNADGTGEGGSVTLTPGTGAKLGIVGINSNLYGFGVYDVPAPNPDEYGLIFQYTDYASGGPTPAVLEAAGMTPIHEWKWSQDDGDVKMYLDKDNILTLMKTGSTGNGTAQIILDPDGDNPSITIGNMVLDQTSGIHVSGDTTGIIKALIENADSSGTAELQFLTDDADAAIINESAGTNLSNLSFWVDNAGLTERMRLTSGGSILTGDSSSWAYHSGVYNAIFGENHSLASLDHSIVAGKWHDIDNSAYNVVSGLSHQVYGDYSAIFGETNVDAGSHNLIFGSQHNGGYPTSSYSFVGGKSSSVGYYGGSASYSMAMGHNALVEDGADAAVAIGNNVQANGDASVAMTEGAIAHANHSVAIGYFTDAENYYATALGYKAKASGRVSLAAGRETVAESYWQTTFGSHNAVISGVDPDAWVATDPLFVIGNGDGVSQDPDIKNRNAMVVYKSGDVDLNGEVTIEKVPAQGGISMGSFTVQ